MKKIVILMMVLLITLSSVYANAETETNVTEDWKPTKPITLLTASSAGSGNDTLLRLFSQYLSSYFDGVQVNVTNQSGGNGIPAVMSLLGSPNDGYTVFGDAALSSSYQLLRDDITYDVFEDRTYIAMIAAQPQVLVASHASGWTNLDDVVADLKKDPANFVWGAIGGNSAATFAVAALIDNAGVSIPSTKKVVQSGGAAILTAVAGNNCSIGSGASASVSTYVKSDSLKAIAVLGNSQLEVLPGVKTAKEQGYPIEVGAWIALSAPKGLDPKIVAVYDKAVSEICANPEFQKELAALGAATSYKNAADLCAFIKAEAESAKNWK